MKNSIIRTLLVAVLMLAACHLQAGGYGFKNGHRKYHSLYTVTIIDLLQANRHPICLNAIHCRL